MNTTGDVAAMSVNEVIRMHPQTVAVFNRYGIDACCGGAASVRIAAERDGADADQVLAELERVIARGA
jgi:iron-sulfur cluster repair protein YtfE (RIC family)